MTKLTPLNNIAKSATFALAIFAASNALAAGGTTPLGDCYNRVITICNQGSHSDSCIDSALDACDDEYGNAVAGDRPTGLKVPIKTLGTLGLLWSL